MDQGPGLLFFEYLGGLISPRWNGVHQALSMVELWCFFLGSLEDDLHPLGEGQETALYLHSFLPRSKSTFPAFRE